MFRAGTALSRPCFIVIKPRLRTCLMKISELIDSTAVAPVLTGKTKNEVLVELVAALHRSRPDLDRAAVLDILLERERLGSTGIGDGIAIPHGKLRDIDHLLIVFGRHPAGVDFDSMDGRPAHLFFLLLAPEHEVTLHLKALARISKILKGGQVRSRLMETADPAQLLSIIAREEAAL